LTIRIATIEICYQTLGTASGQIKTAIGSSISAQIPDFPCEVKHQGTWYMPSKASKGHILLKQHNPCYKQMIQKKWINKNKQLAKLSRS